MTPTKHWIRAGLILPIYVATLALAVWSGFALALACLAGGASPMLSPRLLRFDDYWMCAVVAASVALSQVVFLWPIGGVLRGEGAVRGRGPTVVVGAIVLGLISLAFGLVLNDLFPLDGADLGLLRLAGLVGLNAVVWGAVLLRARTVPVGGLIHRVLAGMLGGGAVVLVLGVGLAPDGPATQVGPAIVAQVLAGTILLWAAGPLVLLIVLRKRFEAWLRSSCATCGYRRAIAGAVRCSECGTAFAVDAPTADPGVGIRPAM